MVRVIEDERFVLEDRLLPFICVLPPSLRSPFDEERKEEDLVPLPVELLKEEALLDLPDE